MASKVRLRTVWLIGSPDLQALGHGRGSAHHHFLVEGPGTWAPHRATVEAAHPSVPEVRIPLQAGVQLPLTAEVQHHREGIGDSNLQCADIICVTFLLVNKNSNV